MNSTTYYVAVRKYNGKESYDYETMALRAIDARDKAIEKNARHLNLPPFVRIAEVKIVEVKQ